MNCNCIDKLREAIKQQYGPEAELELKQAIDLKTYELSAAFPPLYFRYRPIGKNGKPMRQTKRSYIMFGFCPFCGKPTKDEPKEAASETIPEAPCPM